MAWEFHVLVVANVTATSAELHSALSERAKQAACRFTVLMPRSGPDTDARLAETSKLLEEGGLKGTAVLGDPDPIVAVSEIWDPMTFDEVIVSTLPTGMSRWMGLDLPRRLERLAGVPVRHVVAQPPAEVRWERPPEREDHGVLSPLAAAFAPRRS